MDRNEIIKMAADFIADSKDNYIGEGIALTPACVGMQIYDTPVFAFGGADDALYERYKSPEIIGHHFMEPVEWLPGAKTVISFFLPYTAAVRAANAADNRWPAGEWLHGRYEGQVVLRLLLAFLVKTISDAGFGAVAPSLDARYGTGRGDVAFTSNWSERHVAYACGLGTFGLSKGLITRKGIAGRLGSIVTELDLPTDERDYDGIYDYCTLCGVCVGRCPVGAISLEAGKSSDLCSDFLDAVREKHDPRYGCGKCQVAVPCEFERPVPSGNKRSGSDG